ncbi:Gfo/Idh/MocA family oxidoreductase [Chondrinema litorale]|uniref:Gfo/Idh/MocA family oxidoreductase n=1 Tax=Chondrinema litorale TaxID=2994555 RepID=UPI00254359F4|nr:Gfo/Idh/MocA family oxidoreductase [Chondrinema litorale]UZR99325.1 Gfo/Idh/MocA family oxidoreductase [Chondrinema litorale]
MEKGITRRSFINKTSAATAATLLAGSGAAFSFPQRAKKRVVLVGTGIRGVSFWGKRLVENYSDILEFVGLCDINPGRLEFGKKHIGANCPTFTNFDEMLDKTKPELVIVTTKDATHHEFVIKTLEAGIDVLTEKPMTTDEYKCEEILEAERKSGKKVYVGFNYRWSPYMTKIKELLAAGIIGKVTSVDFHWYLNNYHGASYFRRWHGLEQASGSLFVHKSTHHFDLVNWWLDSDPVEVYAMGDLEHYGNNGKIRGANCRSCLHQKDCKYYWDITKDKMAMNLYANNEKYDGYIRDNCLFRDAINIYDKMSAQVKYANNIVLNYSLTTYSPFEGWRIAFNGHDGRIEAWLDIPYNDKNSLSQDELHKQEMSQGNSDTDYEPIIVHKNWEDYKTEQVAFSRGGHGGGDKRLQDKIFRTPNDPDPLKLAAGSRDGAMSCLIGVAARNSIKTGLPVKIADLTSLKPSENRV